MIRKWLTWLDGVLNSMEWIDRRGLQTGFTEKRCIDI